VQLDLRPHPITFMKDSELLLPAVTDQLKVSEVSYLAEFLCDKDLDDLIPQKDTEQFYKRHIR
jgi:hypothetical protein